MDSQIRLFGDDYLTLQHGQSIDSELDTPLTSLDATRTRIDWETRRITGFGYNLGFSRNGVLFDPDAGFVGRGNYSRFGATVNYGWYGSDSSRFQNHQVSLGGNLFITDDAGELETISFGPEWEANWKSGSSLSTELTYNYEDLAQTFIIFDDIPVPVAEYEFVDLQINFNTPEGGLYNAEIGIVLGQFFDGYRYSGNISSRFSLSPRFNLQPYYEINRGGHLAIGLPQRDAIGKTRRYIIVRA